MLADAILDAAVGAAMQWGGPCVIGGDFNRDLDNLVISPFLAAKGWKSVFQIS